MIDVTEEMMSRARDLVSHGSPTSVGYRLMIKPIEATEGLELAEKEKYETLGKAGLITKTDEQKDRESRGTHHGVLVAKGDYAFKAAALGGEDWITVGDVVIFDRYAGVEVELPPGSGEVYRFCNDESILGKMEAKVG